MQPSEAKELAMFLLACFIFVGYHVYLFYIQPRWRQRSRSKHHIDVWKANQEARKAWAVEITAGVTDSLQTYAVQTLRNSITAASFLATACSLIAVTGVGNTILDANKVARLTTLAKDDPVLDGGPSIFSATTKLAIAEAVILFSFLCLTQSIRLQVHMAFYARIIPTDYNKHHAEFHLDELVAMSKRAALCFTLGLRAFYGFIPLLMWAVGPTWMLVITVLEVISLVFTDSLPLPKNMPYQQQSVKQASDVEQGRQPPSGANLHKRNVDNGKPEEQPVCGGD